MPYLRSLLKSAAPILSVVVLLSPPTAVAADDGLQPGEAVVTRFSGASVEGGQSVIDVNGIVARAVDVRNPGGPPRGARWQPDEHRLSVTAAGVGQVFGIAIDDSSPPNIYLTATSAFGLHRTPDNGKWMAGMWGPSGGPGTVWKLSATTGYRPEVFAEVTLDSRPNTGAALGNIAFDRWNQQLLVSDLETGMIHRLRLSDGSDMGHYDHGVEGRANFVDARIGTTQSLPPVAFGPNSQARVTDCPAGSFASHPECWNLADFRRRVWGIGVRRDGISREIRLYYAVWGTQGFGNPDWATAGDEQRNSVWSVRLAPDGSFDTSSVRRELLAPSFFSDPVQMAGFGASQPISDIAFAKAGSQDVMLLAERGGLGDPGSATPSLFSRPHQSRVLRFRLDETGIWQSEGRYDVGNYERKSDGQPFLRTNAAGGADFGFGYGQLGQADETKPDGFVWMTGDSLCSPDGPCVDASSGSAIDAIELHGIQGNEAGGFGELAPEAAFKTYPATGPATPAGASATSYMIGIGDALKTGIGDVAIYQPLPKDVADGWMPPGWVPPGWAAPPGYAPSGQWAPPPWWTAPPGWTPPGGWVPPPWWWLPQPQPLPVGIDLAIGKSAPGNVCPANAICKFTINVTNTGAGFTGPLNISDTVPNGWTFVSASGPWACWQQGGTVSCAHAPLTLAPGQSIKLDLELKPPGAGQPAQIKAHNCAEIDWKGGIGDATKANDKACVEVTFVAMPLALDLEIKKSMPAMGVGQGAGMLMACSPSQVCTFEVSITNKGPQAHTGALAIKDALPAGWTLVSAVSPWKCQQQGNALACGHPATTLAVGQSAKIALDLQPAAAPGGQAAEVENCAEMDWKGAAGDTNKANDKSCLKVPLGAAPSDLAIWKTGPVQCARGGTCSYAVKIVNVGKGRYEGPLALEDRNFQHPGLVLAQAGTSWACKDTGASKIECDLGNVGLDPGASIDGTINVALPGDLPPALDKFKNCVKITKSVGTVSKAESCAEVALKADFDLKPSKSGPAQCGEPGPCFYSLSVWNVGNGDYEGPVTITDTTEYPSSASLLKPSPPWTCTESKGIGAWASSYSLSCSHPWVKLPNAAGLGGTIGYVALGSVRRDLFDTSKTEIKNCAKVGYKGGKPDANPGNDEVCITTPLYQSGGTLTGGAGPHWDLVLDAFGTLGCIWASALGGGCTDYTFTIANEGPSTYDLPMALRIKLPEGAKLKSTNVAQSSNACTAGAWSCQTFGPEVVCRPADCALGKGDKAGVHIDVNLVPGDSPPPDGTIRTVCGELEWFTAPGRPDGIEQQQASVRTHSRKCIDTKITVAKPGEVAGPDLALKKTGPAECRAGGSCSYAVTIINPGKAAFSGSLDIIDGLPAGWALASAGGAKCAQDGDLVRCELASLTLQPGWTETITLTASVPERATRGKVENCARLDWKRAERDANRDNDRSCVKTKVAPATTAPVITCRGGEVVRGECICPRGTTRSKTARNEFMCERGPEDSSLTCQGGEIARGKCLCPRGTLRKQTGRNAFVCEKPEPQPVPSVICIGGEVVHGKCVCPQGAVRKQTAKEAYMCERPAAPPAASVTCDGGNVVEGNCLCPKGTTRTQTGRKAFKCEASPLPACTGGKVRVGRHCVCPDNTVEMRGLCVPKQPNPPALQFVPPKNVPSQKPPLQVVPQVKPQLTPMPMQIICPKGTVWSEHYKKCMPVVQ